MSVLGAGCCGPEVYELAKELGRLLAQNGFTVVCGGLQGVMRAACEGAKSKNGLTIGILPGSDREAANEFVDIPLATSLSHMRNYLVVLNGDIAVAVEGESGTLSELALALKSGKKVIALGRWNEMPGVIPARNAREAVELVIKELAANVSSRSA